MNTGTISIEKIGQIENATLILDQTNLPERKRNVYHRIYQSLTDIWRDIGKLTPAQKEKIERVQNITIEAVKYLDSLSTRKSSRKRKRQVENEDIGEETMTSMSKGDPETDSIQQMGRSFVVITETLQSIRNLLNTVKSR